jgi:acetate CoA/acetoacetate CoA-transferase beta subunit
VGVVDMIITEMGVMEITKDGIVLTELHSDFTVEQVQEATEAELIISPEI